jgi:hypothetical protein
MGILTTVANGVINQNLGSLFWLGSAFKLLAIDHIPEERGRIEIRCSSSFLGANNMARRDEVLRRVE